MTVIALCLCSLSFFFSSRTHTCACMHLPFPDNTYSLFQQSFSLPLDVLFFDEKEGREKNRRISRRNRNDSDNADDGGVGPTVRDTEICCVVPVRSCRRVEGRRALLQQRAVHNAALVRTRVTAQSFEHPAIDVCSPGRHKPVVVCSVWVQHMLHRAPCRAPQSFLVHKLFPLLSRRHRSVSQPVGFGLFIQEMTGE